MTFKKLFEKLQGSTAKDYEICKIGRLGPGVKKALLESGNFEDIEVTTHQYGGTYDCRIIKITLTDWNGSQLELFDKICACLPSNMKLIDRRDLV